MADPAAIVALARAYEPFGSQMLTAGPAASPYGFAGEWRDRTGLVHLRARYYAPYFGAFIRPDPWGGLPTASISQNKYRYVADNPLRWIDPSGLCMDFDRATGSFIEVEQPPEFGACPGSVLEGFFGPTAPSEWLIVQDPTGVQESYARWWSNLPADVQQYFGNPDCFALFPLDQLTAVDPYVLIHYWSVREFQVQKRGAFTPPLAYEFPFVLPIGGGIIPLTIGTKTTEYAVEAGPDRYIEQVWRGYIGIGLKGGQLGGDLQYAAPKTITLGLFGELAGCSLRLTFGSISAGCQGARFSIGWTPRVDRYILTRESELRSAGGYEGFGKRYVFRGGQFGYQVLKEALNPGDMYAMWGANIEELP
jgi:RHS repeat-associated protein